MAADAYTLTVRPDHPALLDLDWSRSIVEWDDERLVDLPHGISRHEVRFLALEGATIALKELPAQAAQRDYGALRRLEEMGGTAVRPLGLVVRGEVDPGSERAAVLLTRYADHSFSYRELLAGSGFGARREQLLDAFAFLLVELHLLGCFWGDCSLSNVLYRYDAGAIEALLVDAETAELHPRLSEGQRRYDLAIMVENVSGEMADIAASQGLDVDQADLGLGADIERRYEGLWREVAVQDTVPADKHYLITERIRRLNEMGFEVEEVEVVSHPEGNSVRMRLKIADRNFHHNRLRELTGVDASENQARLILADLRYYESRQPAIRTASGKALATIRWRVDEFEPWLRRLAQHIPPEADPVQAYCDLLYHRYMLSLEAGRDVGTEAAFRFWLEQGKPGHPLPPRIMTPAES
jgi:hypothetical protein